MANDLIYVCGVPGSGKSAVRRELRRRRQSAFGTDEDGIAAFFGRDGTTIERVDVVDTAEWRRQHTWRIVPQRLDELTASGADERIFICGSVANEADVWDRFTVVIALVVDDETIRTRLAARTGNNFGKSADELALALGWNRSFVQDVASTGAVLIDATRPLEIVVDDVLAVAAGTQP